MAEGLPRRFAIGTVGGPGRWGAVAALATTLAIAEGAAAQRVPLRAGNVVRIAPGDSGGRALWQTGTVLTATRLGVLVRASGPAGDTVPVPLNGSVRVQVERRPNNTVFLVGGIGAVGGVVMGGIVLRSTFGESWGDPGVSGEVIGFGLLGALAGAGVGLLVRPVRWEEIPLTARGFPMTPLSRAQQSVPFPRRERWQAFPPTEEDFAAFLAYWEDSLEAVEGVWELEEVSGPAGTTARFLTGARAAIVRDSRYDGYQYVAVQLAPRGGTTRPRAVGVITFAMRQAERPGFFEIRYTGGSGRAGSHLVEFRAGRLEFRYGSEPTVERWVKLVRGSP